MGFRAVRPGEKKLEYQENQYYGHAMLEALAPGNSFLVGTNHYFVMGDNTFNSSIRVTGEISQATMSSANPLLSIGPSQNDLGGEINKLPPRK